MTSSRGGRWTAGLGAVVAMGLLLGGCWFPQPEPATLVISPATIGLSFDTKAPYASNQVNDLDVTITNVGDVATSQVTLELARTAYQGSLLLLTPRAPLCGGPLDPGESCTANLGLIYSGPDTAEIDSSTTLTAAGDDDTTPGTATVAFVVDDLSD